MQINVLENNPGLSTTTNATSVIQAAIDQCSQHGGGQVVIPAGCYVIDSLLLKSNVDLHLAAGAKLLGSGNEEHYHHRPGPFELLKNETPISGLIYADGQENIAITGQGTIDGNYQQFILPNQEDEVHLKFYKYPRPMMIYFENCRDVLIQGITIQNSPFWTVHLVGDLNTEIDHVTIENEVRMPNTDGVDVDRSKNTYIHDCQIHTGDDAICPKCTEETSQYGDVENLTVINCRIITQSSAVKFGSSSFGNFSNCVFRHLVVRDTNRGLAFQLRDPGSARNIIFEDIDIATKHYSKEWWGSGEPIYITLLPREPKTQLAGSTISNVTFKNVKCRAENGILLAGYQAGVIRDIRFEQVTLALQRPLGEMVEYDLRPDDHNGKIMRPLKVINDLSASQYSINNCRFD
ncbi:glycoside hydrolase family 28 protein [uncultured Limosilactobacillus sp.]|uniref:glycoside hydrolase family 28 protein n=1 Tax=uncultured Limosilactobacillus sp. TaxID=2837629 RepID=UPI0025D2205D|nr:glycosyl hydrolase family 28 protein [uncultured Limosilactobacillus sp.]